MADSLAIASVNTGSLKIRHRILAGYPQYTKNRVTLKRWLEANRKVRQEMQSYGKLRDLWIKKKGAPNTKHGNLHF